jgi:hypothetical protein
MGDHARILDFNLKNVTIPNQASIENTPLGEFAAVE